MVLHPQTEILFHLSFPTLVSLCVNCKTKNNCFLDLLSWHIKLSTAVHCKLELWQVEHSASPWLIGTMTIWSSCWHWETPVWERPPSSTGTLTTSSTASSQPQWALTSGKREWWVIRTPIMDYFGGIVLDSYWTGVRYYRTFMSDVDVWTSIRLIHTHIFPKTSTITCRHLLNLRLRLIYIYISTAQYFRLISFYLHVTISA